MINATLALDLLAKGQEISAYAEAARTHKLALQASEELASLEEAFVGDFSAVTARLLKTKEAEVADLWWEESDAGWEVALAREASEWVTGLTVFPLGVAPVLRAQRRASVPFPTIREWRAHTGACAEGTLKFLRGLSHAGRPFPTTWAELLEVLPYEWARATVRAFGL